MLSLNRVEMTIDAQSTEPKTPSNTGNDSVPVPAVTLYRCGKCQAMLGRHRFQKKLFRKLVLGDGKGGNNAECATKIRTKEQQQRLVCQQCRRIETANRCKQAPPKLLKHNSRRADSGTKRRPNNFGYCDYVDKLFGMDCFATHIAPLKVFTSAKDVSESMAAIQAVFKHGSISGKTPGQQHDEGILCLCIGDGCTPRTALLMAFLAKQQDAWECVSIDPALSEEWAVGGSESSSDGAASTKGVRGLHCYKGTLKEFLEDPTRPPSKKIENQQHQQQQQQQRWRHLVLVCVHSHARFVEEASIENIRSLYSSNTSDLGATILLPTTIVSLPCCPTFRHVRDIGEPPTLKYDDDCVFSACRSVEVWNLEEREEQQKDQIIPPGCYMATNAYCSEDLAFVPNGGMSTEQGVRLEE